jgi:tRNA uridine 5-carboxymethylaminomethyl modification enzyme
MFTSRSEYRLYLRADNADSRLTKLGYEIGCVSKCRFEVYSEKQKNIEKLFNISNQLTISSKELSERGINKTGKRTAFNLMSQDDVSRETIFSIWPQLCNYKKEIYDAVETEAKYSGYMRRQMADIEVFKKDENLRLKNDIDYSKIGGLSNEMVIKLSKIRPSTIGEASRISGVTPAAIMAILGYIKNND